MLEKIAKWLTRKPKLVAMMAVLMLIPAAIGYISTRINYDILSYLPEDLESSHGEKLLEEPFKMAATSMLVVESMPAGYTNSLLWRVCPQAIPTACSMTSRPLTVFPMPSGSATLWASRSPRT